MTLAVVGLLLFQACQTKVPKQYLQPDEFEDLLYDYYVAKGMADNSHPADADYERRYHTETVLRKYGLTQADFDSTLAYYFNHAERLRPIYDHLQSRLSDDALQLGASAGEVERFTTQSISGDTTDVWENRRNQLLMPRPPSHIWQFSQKADTTYHGGDSFLLTFASRYLAQSGSKNATVYLAVTYENDSVITHHQTVVADGNTTLRINACPERARRIDGFVYLSRRDVRDNQADMCLLFLSRIQLVRFHHRPQLSSDSTTVADSVKVTVADSVKAMGPHRMKLTENLK